MQEEKGRRNITKIRVWLRFSFQVPYDVEIMGQVTAEKLKEALRAKDAGDWAQDPDFYEKLGHEYGHAVEDITDDEITPDGKVGIDVLSV